MKKIIEVPITSDFLIIDSDITYTQVPGWLNKTTRDLHLSIIRHAKTFDDQKFPVIFWFGGGSWMDVDYNVYLANLVDYAKAGFVIVSVEYRDSNKVKFPGQLEDAKAAIRYIKKHAANFQIDPNKIIAMGESAGGHLTSMLGVTNDQPRFDTDDNKEFNSQINLAIPWYGVVDPLAAMQHNPTEGRKLVYQNLLGKRPDLSPTLDDRANPLKYIDDNTVPFLILHGTDDTIVPVSTSEELYQSLLDCHIKAELLEIKHAKHMDQRFWQPEVTQMVVNFIQRNIKKA